MPVGKDTGHEVEGKACTGRSDGWEYRGEGEEGKGVWRYGSVSCSLLSTCTPTRTHRIIPSNELLIILARGRKLHTNSNPMARKTEEHQYLNT